MTDKTRDTYSWHIAHNEHGLKGPVTSDELIILVKEDRLDRQDYLWRSGLPEWIRAEQVKGLFEDQPPPKDEPVEGRKPAQAPGSDNADQDGSDQDGSKPTKGDAPFLSAPHQAAQPDTYSHFEDAADDFEPVKQRGKQRKGSFITRHWQGRLSLPVSYWVIGIIVNLVVLYMVGWFETSTLPDFLDADGILYVSAAGGVAVLILVIWQVVGTWRAAGAYMRRYPGFRATWGVLARIMILLAVFMNVGAFIVFGQQVQAFLAEHGITSAALTNLFADQKSAAIAQKKPAPSGQNSKVPVTPNQNNGTLRAADKAVKLEKEAAVAGVSKPLDAEPNSPAAGGFCRVSDPAVRAAPLTETSLNPDEKAAVTHNENGLKLQRDGQYDLAIAAYNKALALNANYADAYDNRAIAHYKKRQHVRAMADFKKSADLTPKHGAEFEFRLFIHDGAGSYDSVIANPVKAAEFTTDYANEFHRRGLEHAAQARHDRAIADFSRALALNPLFIKAYNGRADAYCARGQGDQAGADWRKALEIDPKNSIARANLEKIGVTR